MKHFICLVFFPRKTHSIIELHNHIKYIYICIYNCSDIFKWRIYYTPYYKLILNFCCILLLLFRICNPILYEFGLVSDVGAVGMSTWHNTSNVKSCLHRDIFNHVQHSDFDAWSEARFNVLITQNIMLRRKQLRWRILWVLELGASTCTCVYSTVH